jgi:hypothetical protein
VVRRQVTPGLPISRAGLWLIGGTLALSLAVFAWAFQEPVPEQGSALAERASSSGGRSADEAPGLADSADGGSRRAPEAGRRASSAERESAMALRPPDAARYEPLLGRDLFRPLVTPERRTVARAPRPAPPSLPSAQLPAPSAEKVATDAWRGWRFNGVAQLDQKTYALMDQPGQKRSRFVGPGDRLEDAVVARVQEDIVLLRPAEGGLVEVTRVDAMAELLRPLRSPAAPRGEPPAGLPFSPGVAPRTLAPVVTGPAGLEFAPSTAAGPPPVAGGALDAGERRSRRERQFREPSGDNSTSDDASSEE